MENERPQIPESMHSEQEWQNLIERAQKLSDKVMVQPDVLTHYNRMARALIGLASPENLEYFKGDDGAFQDATESLDLLDRYLILIDQYPEFCPKRIIRFRGNVP